MFLITCRACGKEVVKCDSHPNKNTKMRPKPDLKSRHMYCKKCWMRQRTQAGNKVRVANSERKAQK
jgi:hypothetical protein